MRLIGFKVKATCYKAIAINYTDHIDQRAFLPMFQITLIVFFPWVYDFRQVVRKNICRYDFFTKSDGA